MMMMTVVTWVKNKCGSGIWLNGWFVAWNYMLNIDHPLRKGTVILGGGFCDSNWMALTITKLRVHNNIWCSTWENWLCFSRCNCVAVGFTGVIWTALFALCATDCCLCSQAPAICIYTLYFHQSFTTWINSN